MDNLCKVGRFFYGLAIAVYGIQQTVVGDFRPQIVPDYPAWAHKYAALPIITGIDMIIMGVFISGVFKTREINKKPICLYLGFFFCLLILVFHLPYRLIISPNKAYHLGVWAETLKELAFCGGAFVMAGSYGENGSANREKNSFTALLEKLIPLGRIFFSITMILFGYSHFLYTEFVSPMVPKWFGIPVFWTYFGGVALIGSGTAIMFKILIRPVAFLLATMLFLWFILVHVPNAIVDPYTANGNRIVSAFDALLFCGVALVIALRCTDKSRIIQSTIQNRQKMRLLVLFILTFISTISFAQNKTGKVETGKPFVLGTIDEIQSAELAEKRVLKICWRKDIIKMILHNVGLFIYSIGLLKKILFWVVGFINSIIFHG
jgi:uncharacterized membrane protein